ncbi:MAG: 50S ribosomal protein L24 [Candidatus Dadabacteria bacterium]|nr:MAG: 50S ribosomal protein L24 [Candidatus Dadabacteria bacterium]
MGAKIKRDDMVEVIAGNERGKRGKVLRVLRERDRALVERVNLVKRHMKPNATSQGGILEKEAPIHLSNLALVCEKCDRPVRVGFRVLEDGRKVRACKRCGEVFDK